MGCIASSGPAVWWSLSARALLGPFQSPADIEQMSLSLLEAREAEGWGLPKKQPASHVHAPRVGVGGGVEPAQDAATAACPRMGGTAPSREGGVGGYG